MRGRLTVGTKSRSTHSGSEPTSPGLPKAQGQAKTSKSTFLILGGSRGIGLACVKEAAAMGVSRILVVARDEKAAKAATNKIAGVELLIGNVTVPQDVSRIVSVAREDANLKCVFCHVGIGSASETLPQRINDDHDDLVMATNFLGPVSIALSLIPKLEESAGKLIFTVGQQRFLTRGPPSPSELRLTPSGSRYAASKAALYCIAHEIAKRHTEVGVYLFDPGSVKTDFHPANVPAAAFPTSLEDASEAWGRIVSTPHVGNGKVTLWRSGKEAVVYYKNGGLGGALVFGNDVVEPDAMSALYDACAQLVAAAEEDVLSGESKALAEGGKASRHSSRSGAGGGGGRCFIM